MRLGNESCSDRVCGSVSSTSRRPEGNALPTDARSGTSHDRSVIARAFRSDLPWLLGGVVLAQVADLVTFIVAVGRTGIEAEQNILARALFIRFGDAGPALLKVAAVVTLVLLVRRVALRFPRLAAPAAGLAIGLGILGFASNVIFGLLG